MSRQASNRRGGDAGLGRRDEEAVRRFVERLAMTLSDWGFPRMPARVLATLMSADEPSLTAADLAARLQVSPAAISGAVRYLLHVGLLAREPSPGRQRDRYRLPEDPWYVSSTAERAFIGSVAEVAAAGVDAVGGPTTPAGARVGEMRDFFRFVQGELGELLERWREQRAAATADEASR
jgi:predicted transcriptional regulator